MSARVLRLPTCGLLISILNVTVALGQHDFERTKTVDKGGTADVTSIQGAITEIGATSAKWTVLIYAGTYNEAVTLDGLDENIDLVGVDRDAVIIAPTSGSGIKITSGAETTRNNSIRNLTIKPTDGIGIEIVQGTGGASIPKDIIIDGVTIVAGATGVNGRHGILAEEVENLSIANCSITAVKGHGIELDDNGGTAPKNVTITNCTITGDGSGKNGIDALDADGVILTNSTVTSGSSASAGIKPGKNLQIIGSTVTGQTDGLNNAAAISGLRITRSTIQGTTGGGFKSRTGTITDTVIENSRILGQDFGLHVEEVAEPFTVTSTDIIADGSDNANVIYAFRHDSPPVGGTPVVVLERCFIQAINAGDKGASAIDANNGSEDVRLNQCRLVAETTKETTDTGPAIGINYQSTSDPGIWMINGSIATSSTGVKETEVWDIFSSRTSPNIFVSGVAFSKWEGKIQSADRAQSVLQRMVDVAALNAEGILNNQDLNGTTVTPSFTLGHYRTLQLTWIDASGADIEVMVTGKDWAGAAIAEKFTLTTSAPVANGSKPFKFVEKVFLPSAGLTTLDVGWNNKLGLYYPLPAAADVIQWSKVVSSKYQIQSIGNLTVDADFATVTPNTVTASDDFGFLLLTPN